MRLLLDPLFATAVASVLALDRALAAPAPLRDLSPHVNGLAVPTDGQRVLFRAGPGSPARATLFVVPAAGESPRIARAACARQQREFAA